MRMDLFYASMRDMSTERYSIIYAMKKEVLGTVDDSPSTVA